MGRAIHLFNLFDRSMNQVLRPVSWSLFKAGFPISLGVAPPHAKFVDTTSQALAPDLNPPVGVTVRQASMQCGGMIVPSWAS